MDRKLEIINPKAAGIDIGSRSFFVDAGEAEIKIFPTYTQGCHELRDYLLKFGITTVAMESTGVYWVILYAVLEEAGIEVYLVNGREVRNMPGRKSDIKDCQWLRQLHTYGLVHKSFIPQENIRTLRSYMRLRQDHIRSCSTQIRLMQKALTQMNIRLAEAISDITGASGSRIIKAILGGERKPEVLVSLCEISILKTKQELVLKSLEGEYKDEHLLALRQAHKTYEYYQSLIAECDTETEKVLEKMTAGKDDIEGKNKRKSMRSAHRIQIKNLHQHLLKMTEGKDPTTIAGITDYSFLQIVSEIGVDMKAWPTEKHFVSWLKLSPQKNSSGNMVRRVKVKHHNKAGLLFRNIAQGVLTTKHVALGSFARRIRTRRGSGVAMKAIARKLACFYYRVMTQGEAFVEKGIIWYEQQQKEKQKRYLQKLALKHSMQLVPIT
jgi:transposase